uniref:Ent-kaurenoic acid oxidase 4 n=1 Tax=Scoparia dulcis TaxID=107240 RepID=A0A0N9ZMG2_SCODU|nr:ent-kaurenoic acid oxidase 4 [Scoparia dulcis]
MEETSLSVVMAIGIGIATLGWCILWWWNDIRYALPVNLRCARGGMRLPPGYMGIPFFGEMLTFIWYFKFLGRPDEYIDSKRRKFGDGAGMFRTHMFGSPAIIAYTPQINKLALTSDEYFYQQWPSFQLMGSTSLVAVHGDAHNRLRAFVIRAVNQPNPLRQIAEMVQPRIIFSLDLWAQKGTISVYDEVKKVTFENIGKYFAGFEPGPRLDTLAQLFKDMVCGFRAYPLNFPGTAFHRALQSRKKVSMIFQEEMERRKKSEDKVAKKDLLEGLMRMEDEEGKQLRDVEVLDNIVSLVVGGYESTVLALMWTFYFLAKNPHVLKRLREEHTNIKRQRQNEEFITYDEILKCTYTSKVVEEIIRMANISAFVFRTASQDVEYNGYVIPKGWKVICWLRYLHTNPEHYESPMCFNPDRWDEPPKPGTNLVFGRGSRLCAGNMLAQLQLSIMIHHLAIGYRWELVNPDSKMLFLPHPKPEDGVEINVFKI